MALVTHVFLREHRDEIIRDWESLVLTNPGEVKLAGSVLRDHLPEFLDELAAWLARGEVPGTTKMRLAGSRHVLDRLEHSFQLAQLIGEFRLLRRTILQRLLAADAAELDRTGTEGMAGRIVELARLNDGLDLAISDSVEYFVAERDRRLEELRREVLLRDAVDRRRAEELREAESLREQLAVKSQIVAIANSVPGVICSYKLRPDGSACMPFSAPAIEDLFGISADALAKGMAGWAANVHPDDLQHVSDTVAEAARARSRWHDEYRYSHPTKGLRWIEGWSSPIVEPDGTILWHGYVTDVTERKRVEEALRESEERSRAAFQASPDWITISSLQDGVYITVNAAFVKGTGWSEAEIVGRSSVDINLWDAPADRARLLEKLKRDGHLENAEVLFRTKTRQAVPALVSARIITLNGESVLLSFVRDIGAWKLAQEEMLQTELRLRAFVESDVIGILFGDADGRVYDCNTELCRIIGRAREDVLAGKVNWLNITPPDDLALDDVALAEAAASGRCRPYEKHYLRPDGTLVPVQVGFVLLEPERRKSVAFVLDITDRKRAEEARRRSDAFYRAVHKGSPDFWSVLDADGRATFVSGGASAVVGWTEQELLSRVAFQHVHDDDRERLLSAFHALRGEPGGTRRERYRFRHKDGSWRVLDTVARNLLDDPDVQGVVVNRWDVTEQQRLEQQFQQAQKLEGIGRLAGGVAHDFNNLLSIIQSCAGFALESLRAGDPLREELLEIEKAGKRAASLTRQLLAFSRKQVLQPEPLDLNRIIAEIEKMLHRILGEDIALVQVLASDLGTVKADPGQVEQVIMNLAVNARDAMPEGGKLTIKTANVELDADYAAQHADVKPGPYVMVAVSDSGVGMDEKTMARVFEPFFTTKEPGKGTGLGLSTAYGIVKQSGGSIYVYSELGRGTTFKVFLPRELSLAPVVKRPTAPTRSSGAEIVLVVEDDEAVRNVAKRILGAAGYTVLTAANGQEGLLLCEQHPAEIHLVLTDVVMPLMSGRVFAEHLAKVRPGIKVLYMSGYTDDAIIHHGVLDAGTQFISKPLVQVELLRKVREVLDA